MERVHFLNVKQGDCIWIEHNSGRDTVIDICNGNAEEGESLAEEMLKNLLIRLVIITKKRIQLIL